MLVQVCTIVIQLYIHIFQIFFSLIRYCKILSIVPSVAVWCSNLFDSLQPHGLQPIKLLYPWNFPGKFIGMGFHFLLQRIFLTQDSYLGLEGLSVSCITGIFLTTTAAAAKSFQSCPTLCDPIDGSPPGSAFPGILQARTLEWVAISFSSA